MVASLGILHDREWTRSVFVCRRRWRESRVWSSSFFSASGCGVLRSGWRRRDLGLHDPLRLAGAGGRIDMPLCYVVALSLFLFWKSVDPKGNQPRLSWFFYVLLAVGMLLKGPVAVLLIGCRRLCTS